VSGNGAFSQAALGYPAQTMVSNMIVKRQAMVRESFGIGMVDKDSLYLAPTPELRTLHATVCLPDRWKLQVDYEFFDACQSPTSEIHFLSVPDCMVVPPPLSETQSWMRTKCA
jgi:hypothetical protein